jgi:hypothetical protein
MLEVGRRGVASGGGKRRQCGGDRPAWDGDEGADRWGPHVSEGREKAPRTEGATRGIQRRK